MRRLGSAVGNVGMQVFRSQSEWSAAVDEHPWSGGPGREFPTVDWKREMVVTVSDGEKPTTGYGIHIVGVDGTGSDYVVRYAETRPARGMMEGQMITYPSDAAAVARSGKTVRFEEVSDNGTSADSAPDHSGDEAMSGSTVIVRRSGGAHTAGTAGLAKYLFAASQEGGIAAMHRQTIVRLNGRPLTPSEKNVVGSVSRDVQATGPGVRQLEQAVRNSGFLTLASTYGRRGAVADQMTRTIRVFIDGRWKSVTVRDGSGSPPAAFEKVWSAIMNAGPAHR